MEDDELLQAYAKQGSERAFTELVSRHIDLVYSTAIRLLREPHLARDVAQAVFISLARKPGAVRNPRALAGWLYRTTRFTAGTALRGEVRRRAREETAVQLMEMGSDPNSLWS